MSVSTTELRWNSDHDLEVAGTRFLVSLDADEYLAADSTVDRFVLAKSRAMVERLVDRTHGLEIRRIVDIGIYKGGSTALLASLFDPVRLTALEVSSEPIAALSEFIDQRGLEDRIRPRYGIDQSDTDQLVRILDDDHGAEPLDLVVDDASHLYAETRASFEVLFPRLRPGGVFIIEDWAWAHFPGDLWQEAGGYFHDRPALTNLVVEILMTLGTGNRLVAEVHSTGRLLEVVRGDAVADGPIELEREYLNRGMPFRPLL